MNYSIGIALIKQACQTLSGPSGNRKTWMRSYWSPLTHGFFAAVGMVAAGQSAAQECGTDVLARATFARLYVPAYSQVQTDEGIGQPLASTMVVHNVDPKVAITVTSVTYLDRSGAKLTSLIDEAQKLAPFGSQSFLVPISEQSGGFGANYIVEWTSANPALTPIIEAIMVGGGGT